MQQEEVAGKLEELGWERSGSCWRNYPFMLTRRATKFDTGKGSVDLIPLWHLERIDEHPGHAWFSDTTVPWLFTIVDAEVAAWQ